MQLPFQVTQLAYLVMQLPFQVTQFAFQVTQLAYQVTQLVFSSHLTKYHLECQLCHLIS